MFPAPTTEHAVEPVTEIEAGSNQVEIKHGTPVLRPAYFSPDIYQELLPTCSLIEKLEGYGFIPFMST